MKIEIIGNDGSRSQKAEQIITAALKKFEKTATVEQVSDTDEIAKRGALLFPAISIDGAIKFQGRIPSIEELSKALV
jgi:hypothetical protein